MVIWKFWIIMRDHKPTTPSRRHMTTPSYRERLTADSPHKKLTKGFRRGSGRNNLGRITTRHVGGGHKRRFRDIDFRYDKKNIPAKVETIEYDPNRSGFIALICFADGERRYILAPRTLEVGDELLFAEDAPQTPGNRMPLSEIPVGTFVYNIELNPGGGAKLARSAGNAAEVIARDKKYVTLKMPSTEVRKVPANAWASIGEVSNSEHKLRVIGKAGRNRWLGKRPTVRGSAMNAVDHPMGGGEGRGGRGHRHQKTKWGKRVGKGQKTRPTKKYSDKLIVSRRKKKKRKK